MCLYSTSHPGAHPLGLIHPYCCRVLITLELEANELHFPALQNGITTLFVPCFIWGKRRKNAASNIHVSEVRPLLEVQKLLRSQSAIGVNLAMMPGGPCSSLSSIMAPVYPAQRGGDTDARIKQIAHSAFVKLYNTRKAAEQRKWLCLKHELCCHTK